MKMERRDFLKFVGASLFSTLHIVAAKNPVPTCADNFDKVKRVPQFATGGLVELDRFPVQVSPGEVIWPRHVNCKCVQVDIPMNPIADEMAGINKASREIAKVLDRVYA